MPIAVSVQFDRAELRALQPGKINRPLVRAVRKAGSKALRDMQAELSKRVRQRKRIKARMVRNALRITRAKGSRIENMEWKIEVSNAAVPLDAYPFKQLYGMVERQTKSGISQIRAVNAGVQVQINRGQKTVIKQAFIATMKSGKTGIWKRVGQKRLPISLQHGSRVIDAVSHKGEVDAIHRRGQTTFRRSFDALLPVEMSTG